MGWCCSLTRQEDDLEGEYGRLEGVNFAKSILRAMITVDGFSAFQRWVSSFFADLVVCHGVVVGMGSAFQYGGDGEKVCVCVCVCEEDEDEDASSHPAEMVLPYFALWSKSGHR